ncbi:sugar ABC transporter substrate-binding protein, partial [Streptomyces sp. NPDC006365]
MPSTRHALIAGATATALLLAGCAGAGGGSTGGGDGESINVLMVGNPQMEDIAKLTKSTFTKDTG